jgi:hypothetical protein
MTAGRRQHSGYRRYSSQSGYSGTPLAVNGPIYDADLAADPFDRAEVPQFPAIRSARPSRAVIIRRRALLAAVAAAMLVMLALPWGGTGGRTLATPGAARAGPLVAGTTYVVRPGDTLWGIAERLADGSDPRPLVEQLETQARGDVLQPGEVLRLP